MCDRDMISSPDDNVVRSSTEDHVVQSSRDRSVADHHTPDPNVGSESRALEDRLDAEPSVQNRYLQNRNDLLVRDRQSRSRPMSSRVYNPLPFKKRFLSVPQTEDVAAEPKEEVNAATIRESIVDVNPGLSGRVSPTSPRLFSPVPYSRHCYSYSPIHWQNPSVSRSPTEVETENKEIDDGQNPTETSCMEERPEVFVSLDKGKSDGEHDNKADEVLEMKSSNDNQIITEGKLLDEEKVNVLQLSSEEPMDIEAVDGQNPTVSNASDEWLIDQHSPVDNRPLLEEWTKKRSEDYQKSLKRPLTAILEEEAEESVRDSHPLNNKDVDPSHCHSEKPDGVEIELANKSPLRDSLEEFIQLEKYFEEEEKRRNDQLIDMKPDIEPSHCHTEKTAEDGVEIELANKSPLRDSLKEFIIEEEKRKNEQLIDRKPNEESDSLDGLDIDPSQCLKEQTAEDGVEIELANKSPFRDSLINEEEKRKNEQMIDMKPSEISDGLDVDSSQCHTEKTAEDGVEIELVNKSPLRDSLEEFIRLEKYFEEEEKRRNDQLIDMKPGEVSDALDKTKCDEEVKKPNIVAKVMNKFKTKRQTKARKKEKDEEYKEMEDLKKAFEEQLKEKVEFEKLIEKQENDLKGQLREMDEVMETVQSEHDELEKATKEFADTMKVHTKCRTEITRTRVQISQEEISLSMLQSDNSDLEKELRDVYDDIEEIHERRSVGLEGLKQKIIDVKCESETMKEENDEIEAGTKKKMTEFNELRMTVMEKGITYVKKGTIVKGASTVRFPDMAGSKSPPPKPLSRSLDIDLVNIDNVPPDIKTPRISTPDVCTVDKSSKCESDDKIDDCDSLGKPVGQFDDCNSLGKPVRQIDDCDSLGKPVRQMSTLELVRLPGAREVPSKIPKPTYQLYGSSIRDSERYTVSDEDSKRMVESKDYKRDNFVKEGERNATKFTCDFIDRAGEHERILALAEQGPYYTCDFSGKSQYEYWRNYNAKQEKIKNEMNRRNTSQVKRNLPPLQKQAGVPKRIIKKEVKSKIDTGLKNRHFNQKRDLSANKKDIKKTNGPVRSSTGKNTKREPPSAKGKTKSLPPLKKAQNESEIPRSPSFGNKAPLPGIQPSSVQKMKKNKITDKKAVTRSALPPIKPPNAGRLPAVQKDNKPPKTGRQPAVQKDNKQPNAGRLPAVQKDNKQPTMPPKRRAPEVMWISFSPTPPANKGRSSNRRSPDSGRA